MKKIILATVFYLTAALANVVEIESVEVLQNILKQPNRLMVFDLYADWCRPCKLLAPILEELSIEREDVQFYKIDIEKNREIATAFHVRSIPLVVYFKNGEFIGKSEGLYSKEYYLQIIEYVLSQ